MNLAQTSPSTVMMAVDEAEMIHRRILARDKAQGKDLQRMYEEEGWKALGYKSWDMYMRTAFDYSVSYLSRLNTQVKINAALGTDLPERQTRALKKLDSTTKQQQAYEIAKEIADVVGEDVKLNDIETAVEQVELRDQVKASKHGVVSVMMSYDEISVHEAVRMCDALDKLDDITYGKVISIIAKTGLSKAELIVPFADMVNRESRTLQRILNTGYINGKLIRDASLADLKGEKRESQSEIIGEKVEQQRQELIAQGKPVVVAHIVTVYEGDAERTLKALKQVLSDADLSRLVELLN